MQKGPLLAIAALLLCVGGCARIASVTTGRLMVRAPNRLDPRIRMANFRPIGEPDDGVDQRFWVAVGPPRADLLVSVVEPTGDGTVVDPKGTVLLLHGAYRRSENMLPAARALVAKGFRAVTVDLRGHGRSTGDRITYGVQESADLCQVIDALSQRGLVAGGLGVYGYSFGAATAIQLAGRDPRVGAVVAVASFSRLKDAAGSAARAKLAGAEQYADEQWVEDLLHRAGREGAFDPEQADAVAAIERTRAMVLLVHGDADRFVEPKHSLALHHAGWRHSQVVFVPGADHSAAGQDESGKIARLAGDWFDRWLPKLPGPAGWDPHRGEASIPTTENEGSYAAVDRQAG